MAFDFYLDEERVYIDHHEEGIFDFINGDDKYPQLNWVWEQFYDDPLIQPNMANNLVHELITLRQEINGKNEYKYLLVTIDRILPLLSKAYRSGRQIKCKGD